MKQRPHTKDQRKSNLNTKNNENLTSRHRGRECNLEKNVTDNKENLTSKQRAKRA